MGRSIYFTDRELSMVRAYVFEATDILGNASDTAEQVDEDMENGLGSALRKLYKGCNGESKYAKYKTKRGWKIAFKEVMIWLKILKKAITMDMDKPLKM